MYAKKTLGQNFLTSIRALTLIRDTAGIAPDDTILEIGPGRGALTTLLIARAAKVIAVEKDESLAELLKQKFEADIQSGKLEIIAGDILELDINIFKKYDRFKIVANIPYYITGAIFQKFLQSPIQPRECVFLVQKEVAERIVAKDKKPFDSAQGKESLLSLSVKAYGTARIVAGVKAGSFTPKPNVDSAILHISNISKSFFEGFSEENFFKIIKAGFAHKRKTIANNLKEIFGKETEKILSLCSVDKKQRAEDLLLSSWQCLAVNFTNLNQGM